MFDWKHEHGGLGLIPFSVMKWMVIHAFISVKICLYDN